MGSGFSSALMLDAYEELNITAHLTFIDPYTNRVDDLFGNQDFLSINYIRTPVQKLGNEIFSSLNKDDLLFIDSSHIMKTAGDLNYIFFEILPVFKLQGFDLNNPDTQIIGDNTIYSYDYFCPMPFEKADEDNPSSFITKNTYAIHLWNAAWFDLFRFFWSGRRKKAWKAIRKKIISNPFQGWEFYRNVFYYIRK